MSIFFFLIMIILAYLCGCLCSAILVSKLFALPDPSREGSKNPGATNVLRLAGKKYAALVLLGDMLKGVLPVLLAKLLGATPTMLGFVAFAAIAGHIYPIFFNFKGGKGVATALGALLALQWILGLSVLILWFVIAAFTRYASLASMIALGLAPFLAIPILGSAPFLPLLFISILILYKHYANILRLIDGTEPKLKT